MAMNDKTPKNKKHPLPQIDLNAAFSRKKPRKKS
jgi:hypothetical protein